MNTGSLETKEEKPSGGNEERPVSGTGTKSAIDTIQDIKDEAKEFIKETKLEIRDQKTILVFGFLVLLIMVLGILVDVSISKWESIRDLSLEINKQDSYIDRLDKKVDYLIFESN